MFVFAFRSSLLLCLSEFWILVSLSLLIFTLCLLLFCFVFLRLFELRQSIRRFCEWKEKATNRYSLVWVKSFNRSNMRIAIKQQQQIQKRSKNKNNGKGETKRDIKDKLRLLFLVCFLVLFVFISIRLIAYLILL